MEPTNYVEYIRACPNEASTEDLQLLYTWLGKSKWEFKLRGFLRRQIENRTKQSPKELQFNFNESKYLDDLAQASVRDNSRWCY